MRTGFFFNWGGNSLAVHWLGPHAFTAAGLGSVSGQGTKVLQATSHATPLKKELIMLEKLLRLLRFNEKT